MKPFQSIYCRDFERFMDIRKNSRSENTYLHDYEALHSFDELMKNQSYKENYISEKIVADWIKTLQGKSVTKTNKIISLRIFLRYIEANGVKVFIPDIPKPKKDYSPYIFSKNEINRILSAADNLEQNNHHRRKLYFELSMLLRLLYSCGLRLNEALKLKISDIDFSNGILILRETKKYKQRYVPMHHSLTEMIHKYCTRMNLLDHSDAFLFSNYHYSESVNVQQARLYFNKFKETAGIHTHRAKYERGPCMHCFRHVFVFNAFRKLETEGINLNDAIPYLSIYLGHESLNETDKYLNFSGELFVEDLKRFENFSLPLFPEVTDEE